MGLTRLPDWEPRLAAYLEAVRERPHAYGRHDCALFAASAVQAMTGVDPAAVYRGHYRTKRGAARALRRFGAGTLLATFDAAFPPMPPALARRGDLVMVDGSIGVCVGGEAMLVGDAGLVRHPRRDWQRAWAV